MPDPIPVVELPRLAVDRSLQRQGIARALLRDGGQRIQQAANTIGILGLLRMRCRSTPGVLYMIGFEPSPFDPMTLMMITAADLEATLT